MIYNLSKFITDETSITPITNGNDASVTSDSVLLIQTGGEYRPVIKTQYFTAQVLALFHSRVESFANITEIYNALNDRYGIDLPEVIVGSVTFPEVHTSKIVALQTPGYIGTDDNGRHMWSVNFMITV